MTVELPHPTELDTQREGVGNPERTLDERIGTLVRQITDCAG